MRFGPAICLLFLSGAAWAQPPQCEEGADLQRRLERLVERRADDHPRVVEVAAEIKELQRGLLDANPGKTIEEICNVPETAASTESDADEMICRREQIVGSHRRVRICMTRAERAEARTESQESIRLMRGGN